MLDLIAKTGRWTLYHLRIARGFVCWCFFMVWPTWRGGWFERVGFAVLPYAGDYAYADDPWVREVWGHWISTGRHLDPGPDEFRALSSQELSHDQ